MTTFFENPVLLRELRARMRGAKAFWLLLGFVGVLGAILSLSYWSWVRYSSDEAVQSAILGRQFYFLLFGVLAALVCLITPALTCGALSLERENRTYEALEVSLLPRPAIVLGKLGSAAAFVLFLLSASLPLTAVSFLLGGISPGEVAGAYLLLAVSALVYGALGLAVSAFVRTTVAATLITYVAIAALFAATLVLSLTGARETFFPTPTPERACLVALNPVGAMVGATATERYFGLPPVPSWLTALVMNGLLATLFSLTAPHRLEGSRSTRTPLLRGLSAAFFLLTAFFLSGSFLANNLIDWGSDGLTATACALIGGAALLAMLFASGDGAHGRFLALREASPKSGATFTLLTVALGCAQFAVGALANRTLYGWWQPLLVVLSATFGLCAVALGASARLKNRWLAMGTVAALSLLLFVGPVIEYTTTQGSHFDRLLFLSPFAAASDAINQGDFRDTVGFIQHRGYHITEWTFWEVTVGFYLLVGALGLALSRKPKQ